MIAAMRTRPLFRLAVLFVALVAWSAVSACARSAPASTTAGGIDPAFEQAWRAITPVAVPAPPGPEKVTVAIFLDWQCPACRAEYRAYTPVLAEIQAAHPGAVRVLMKDFPLNSRCNAVVPIEMHGAACEAAVAVRLAAEHGTTELVVTPHANPTYPFDPGYYYVIKLGNKEFTNYSADLPGFLEFVNDIKPRYMILSNFESNPDWAAFLVPQSASTYSCQL